jgi:hypothetical protein
LIARLTVLDIVGESTETNNPCNFKPPSVRSADQERESLPVASDEEGALPITRRRKR